MVCAHEFKKTVGFGLRFLCKDSGYIGDVHILRNYSLKWHTKLSKGLSRTDENGYLVINTNVTKEQNILSVEGKGFKRDINLIKGPYEIYLEQKECNPLIK